MQYFQDEFLMFFKELAANNNRDWFHANKKRYEAFVKLPTQQFVGDLIAEMHKINKEIVLKPHEAMFRINRDIRFSKDKSPYKLYTSAAISPDGKKGDGRPGIYVELGPEKLGIAGGIYMPDKEKLERIRMAMAKKPKAFMQLMADKTFVKYWGTLQGEKNKIIPAEWKESALICPWIYNKQFYFWAELDPTEITSKTLLKTILTYEKAARSVSLFLDDACK